MAQAQTFEQRVAVEVERQRQALETLDQYWRGRGYVRGGNIYRKVGPRNTAEIRRQRRQAAFDDYDYNAFNTSSQEQRLQDLEIQRREFELIQMFLKAAK